MCVTWNPLQESRAGRFQATRARGNPRGFSPGAAVRHSRSARTHTDLIYFIHFFHHIFLEEWMWDVRVSVVLGGLACGGVTNQKPKSPGQMAQRPNAGIDDSVGRF